MTSPGNNLLVLVLTLSVFLSSAYAIGRIHQWKKYGRERDEAYRIGYEKASRAIISVMADRRPTADRLPIPAAEPGVPRPRLYHRDEADRVDA